MTGGGGGIGPVASDVEARRCGAYGRPRPDDVQIFSQKDHVNVVGLGGLAIVRVLVPVFQLETAIRVLAEHDSGRSGTE